MKLGLYEKYYKLGFEHLINKKYFRLHKPNVITDIFYLSLITLVITISYIVF